MFAQQARQDGFHVIVRTNLTIMLEEGYTDLPEFCRDQEVHLVASLPCYLEESVDKQRGLRTYEKSVQVLRKLNQVGYGIEESLPLDLVFNPIGGALPPDQSSLERDYHRELGTRFGIEFTHLLTITNMPIGRFLHDLKRDGKLEAYETLLRESFNPATIDGLMCRSQIHVRWDGMLSDCDFNYALGMRVSPDAPQHISEFNQESLAKCRIATDTHCFACTAGCGSSCGGALA